MDAECGVDFNHGASCCLPGLFDVAAGGLADRSEFEAEVESWGIVVRGLSREDVRALIAGSTYEIPAAERRTLHQEEGDFARRGRRWAKEPWPSTTILLAARPLPVGARRA